jgi:hypothetical protein
VHGKPTANQDTRCGARKSIPLQAKTDADVGEIYWFAGRKFIGNARPREVFLWNPSAGDYELTALDDHGRAGSLCTEQSLVGMDRQIIGAESVWEFAVVDIGSWRSLRHPNHHRAGKSKSNNDQPMRRYAQQLVWVRCPRRRTKNSDNF